MAILIGHASISETGGINGDAGDSTGSEVCTRRWYSKPWDFMAIYPDEDVREAIASTCEDGCANDNIGYGQSDRNTLNTQAKKVNYDLSKITTKCNCDCSSFMNVCCVAAGVGSYGSNGWTTSTMKTQLKNAGFEIITDSTYLTSSSYCVRGAIYVKSSSHTVCGLSNGSNYQKTLSKAGASGSSSSSSSSSSSLSAGDKVTLSNTPIYASATASAKAGTKTGTYYIWSASTSNGRIRITNSSSNVGKSGQVTGWVNVSDISSSSSGSSSSSSSTPSYTVGNTYTLQVDRLTVRTGAGTNYSAKSYSQLTDNAKENAYSNGTLKKGTKVTCQATKKNGSDVWMQIPSGWIAAYYDGEYYVK